MKKDIIRTNIEALCKKHEVSISQLARDVDLRLPTVRKVLAGATANPGIYTLTPIATYFGISLGQLLDANFDPDSLSNCNSEFLKVPMIPADELYEIKDALDTLGGQGWPDYLPIKENKKSKLDKQSLLAVEASTNQFPQPFSNTETIILNIKSRPRQNNFVFVANLETKSVTIKKVSLEGTQIWLNSLTAGIPVEQFDKQKSQLIGVIIKSIDNRLI